MILISHRGNISYPNKDSENKPEQILNAINQGYNVEIDVRFINGYLFLGHDLPQYQTSIEFLKNDKLWCHAKNIEAFELLLKENIHCFMHDTDNAALTSKGYVWTFPAIKLIHNSIAVMPERANYSKEELSKAVGICSDYIINF